MTESRPVATYALTETEKLIVEDTIRECVPPYQPNDYRSFMEGCRRAAGRLPTTILSWRDRGRTVDVALLQNLPVGSPLPATPCDRPGPQAVSMMADAVIGTFATLYGTLYTIQGKAAGRHIHDVCPVRGDEYTQLGSSQTGLLWHVEEAFHPMRPTWLSLLCLRGDPGAVTKVARARDLDLPAGLALSLRERCFKLQVDETYGSLKEAATAMTCVLAGPTDDPEIVLDPAYTLYEDESQLAQVNVVADAAERAHQAFTLQEGDLLVFNNRRAVHARTAFAPRKDGMDRWLKRAFMIDGDAVVNLDSNGCIHF